MAEFLPHLPTREEIMERAIKIFQEEYMRTHPEAKAAPTPTEKELREGSYWERARSELMSGVRPELEKYLHYLEEEAEKVREALGIRPPPELPELMRRLEDLEARYERARERLREAKRQLEEARKKIEELKKPPPPPKPPEVKPPPPKPRELSKEEIKRLEDLFRATLFRELGRIPRNAMAEFRVELDAVKTLPYEEAQRVIERLARDIITREIKPPVVRPPAPPVYVPPMPRPPPGVPYGVIIKTPEMLKAEIMKKMRPNMSPEEVIKAIREVYGWQYTEEAAASYYRGVCLEMGWPIPDWVKEKLGISS